MIHIWSALSWWALWQSLTGALLGLWVPSEGKSNTADMGQAISYAIELIREPSLAVRVSVKVAGSNEGTSTFGVNKEWGGTTANTADFHEVKARGADGKSLSVESISNHQWRVAHKPSEEITVIYEHRPSPERDAKDVGNDYRTILRDGLFHMIGNNGLFFPEYVDSEAKRKIELTWRGFTEAGWKVVSSFNPDASPVSVDMSLDEFRHALFLAGDLRLYERNLRGGRLGISIHGKGWRFEDSALVDLIGGIIEMERAFFEDWSDKWYLVSLIPSGPDDPHSLSLGGTGLTNSFALFFSCGVTLEPGSPGEARMKHILAHEYFHRWNGGRIDFPEPEQNHYWFSEGFTDFYARRLLFRSGMFTREQYLADWNESLKGYYTSPVRDAPASRIVSDFWKDPEVQKLPYRRGDVVALLIDHRIRKETRGKMSLDDLMREWLARPRERNPEVSNDLVLKRVAEITGQAFADEVRRIVEDGAMITLPPDVAAPELELTTRKAAVFDLGFDDLASITAKKITGVREGSAAYRAGLRDDQKLAGLSMVPGDADTEVSLTVMDGDSRKEIRYFPAGEGIEIPSFRLRDNK